MKLTTYACTLSSDVRAAMQCGLESVGQSDAEVLVSADFVRSVQQLEPSVP